MGHISKADDAKMLRTLLTLAGASLEMGWFVIISTGSGNGWTITARRDENLFQVRKLLDTFDGLLKVISSQNFTDSEFNTYAKFAKITFRLPDIKEATRGNPLLLSYFKNCGNNVDYRNGIRKIQNLSRNMIGDLTELLQATGDKFLDTLDNCLELITCCIEQTPLSESKMDYFIGS